MNNKTVICGWLALGVILLSAGAASAQMAVRYDFDGDGKTDPVLYEPFASQWLVLLSGSDYALASVAFEGLTGLAPVAADFDGDGLIDPAGYDEYAAVFSARLSGSAYNLATLSDFGGVGFTPVAADFDGDRFADPALYEEESGTWLVRLSSQGYASNSLGGFGGLGWTPLPADYDGDRKTDPAIYHGDSGTWRFFASRDGALHELALGGPDYRAVYGDFDGDSLADPAVYKEEDGTWAVWLSGAGSVQTAEFGGWDLDPAAGDYDGDQRADLMLHCPSNSLWSALLSADNYAYREATGDGNGAMCPDSLGAHPADNDKPLPYTRSNWMSGLDTNKYLSEITLPGTHDTGADLHTSQQGALAAYVICQDYRLANQLQLGVRWFDIRLRLYNGALCVHHGSYYLHKNFDDLLQPALDFLKAGSAGAGEVVVFMIKQEYSSASDRDFGAAVYAKLQAHGLGKFYLQNKAPRLGEARGKIVIVRRFNNAQGADFGMQFNWDDNTKGASFSAGGINIYVQDHYSLNTVAYSEKIGEIENTLALARNETDPQKFYLNYTSGEKDARLVTLWTVASNIHPALKNYLGAHGAWRRCGIVMLNFAGGSDKGNRGLNPELVEMIIQLNNF
jgi:1-phosphatidylinositol phosphodiesterase